jgi:poly(beta-D-mannuronate) lyase
VIIPIACFWITGSLAQTALAKDYKIPGTDDWSVLSSLREGDTVMIEEGTYVDIQQAISGSGTESKPITVYAQTLGGVKFTGTTGFTVSGDHITVAGLVFDGTGETVCNVFQGRYILLMPNSQYCRVTNCVFDNNDDTQSTHETLFVELAGFNHRIDHNVFEGKNDKGPSLYLKPEKIESKTTPRHHRVDHNYFGPRSNISLNGYEGIRVSWSGRQNWAMDCLVEYNYFYKTIDAGNSGESEVISSKSGGNVYRYNTLEACYGEIHLRHGDGCTVESNFFIGPNNATRESGVIVVGENHIVRNNYFESIKGGHPGGYRYALVLMKGNPDWAENGLDTSDNTYEAPNNCMIANNTFVNCENPVNFGCQKNLKSTAQKLTYGKSPENVTFINNVFQSQSGAQALVVNTYEATAVTFTNNYGYHPDGLWGALPSEHNTLTSSVSPRLEEKTGFHRIGRSDVGPSFTYETGTGPRDSFVLGGSNK